jgi:signal transduction histidine kinase
LPASPEAEILTDAAEKCDTEVADARREAEALRRENARRYDHLMTLVHEFRNPLTALAGAAEILEDSLGERLGDKEREFFDVIEVSLARLNQMLDEMLELTSLESREVELRYEATDVAALARDVLAEAEARAEVFDVKLNPVLSKGDTPDVECDPVLITRVLANMVSNAVKYNRPGGEVTVTLAAGDGSLRVDVADTGMGIPEEDFDKVFTRFYRAPEVRQKKIAGTGLGLTIAKHIVELHGGEMSFSSAPGEGSTFTFEIPTRKPERGASADNGQEG